MNMSIPTMYPHQPMPPHGYQNYYPPTMAVPLPVANPVSEVTRPGNCYLSVRQQPREAQVTDEGKEKVRKPIDPPPILQLKTHDNTEPSSNILQNPYIFVSATLYKAERNEPVEHTPNKSLAGTLVSSMHRLKDIDNKDGGFFVFGDISVRLKGTFRLCFTMYEFQPSKGEFQHLSSIISDKFDVVPSKDFKGLEESTYLSRAFSDQGVRLRLRKESRGMMKRGNGAETESTPQQASIAPSSYDYQSSKRKREDYILPPSVDAPSMTSFQSPSYEFQSSKRRREDYVPFQSGINPYAPHPYPVYQMSYPMVPTYEPDDGLG